MASEAFEDALRLFVVKATGLPDQRVVWARQAIKLARPYATLFLDGPTTLSATPERSTRYVEGAEAGEEIELAAIDQEAWSLRIQTFTDATSGAGDAAVYLKRVKDALKHLSTVHALRRDAITVVGVGSILDLSAVIETGWQGRSALDLRLQTADVSTERTTYIEEVQGQGEQGLAGTNLNARLITE